MANNRPFEAIEHPVERRESSSLAWILDPSTDEDRERLLKLMQAQPPPTVHDAIEEQLRELINSRRPDQPLQGAHIREAVDSHLQGRSLPEYGRWVYMPWSHRLVHLLPPDEFHELRTCRNRYKILPAGQQFLRERRIGIAGLSVGLSAAVTLALEGIGGVFRLADFDTLALSNLNRLRVGVHNIGVNKAVLAARELLELDPYLRIETFEDGVTEQNIDRFLIGHGKLDLLVEECDDLYMKVRLRERARELGIPVLMDTSDAGLIDIERFDREPTRELFHGLVPGLEADSLKGLTTKEKVPFVLAILGASRMSAAMAASLCEVKETISTWPQLGSSVTLGGALVADVARRILLGELTESGRYYVDPEVLIHNGSAIELPAPEPLAVEVVEEAARPPAPVSAPRRSSPSRLRPEDARYLVEQAAWAPSGGNCQPWRFKFDGKHLHCTLDEERSFSFTNFQHLASYAAIGAAVENICLSSQAMGFDAEVDPFPSPSQPQHVATISFKSSSRTDASPLFHQIQARCTNRRLGEPRRFGRSDQEALRSVLSAKGAQLAFVSDRPKLDALGQVLGVADRVRFLSPVMHKELMHELRWTPKEVLATRDGLDLATLEFKAADKAVLRILSSPSAMTYLRKFGGGRALERPSREMLEGASAACLLAVPGFRPRDYFHGGRDMQRVWLFASARGLAVQPFGLPYLLARLRHGEGYADDERALLQEVDEKLGHLFPVPEDHAQVILLRITHADPPSARSLRRRVDDVFSTEM
ncbi:MAG: Rv1355c family protein [Deltaproteobacteria bacterium]|nr:Rv1355c family protein [Deltaproteobacteria bacterium]